MKKQTLQWIKVGTLIAAVLGFLFAGSLALWAATLTIPSLTSFESRRVEQSTKIYDRTGEVLLYDLHQDIKRTVVPFDEISRNIKNATIAIEDENFYNHHGIEPTAIVRAVLINLKNGNLLGGQGGSTITQQVVKNSLLTKEKKISRKLKEWVLALRLEREISKDEILEIYLNESPYGGNKYGVEEASQSFFGKSAANVTLAEAAYLAALPQAPTYYSPYGNHRDDLETRKNLVLKQMLNNDFITREEYEAAMNETVEFLPQQDSGIKAPHFVFYVIEQIEEIYGKQRLEEGGMRVITTLDWELQAKGEEIVERHARENAGKYNASNAALVALDPRSGDIITMVGSRDYFDDEIQGNFNVTVANRQPGSAFKPFAYAAAIEKGYTTETVVFDVPTQFSTACEPNNFTSDGDCYSPGNYDNVFRGPMTFRNALAQSVNIPAVKVVYLAGVRNVLNLAERMGLTTLADASRYGLTLVLGGGEVKPLEMAGAYGAFATGGELYPHRAILRVEDMNGKIIDEFETSPKHVLNKDVALYVTDMLADNTARTPAFGANSYLHFPGRDVAAKTGTTNDYRDAWIIGYTPDIVAAAWAGNNDNSSMEKRVAGFIIAPLWNEYMQEAFKKGYGDSRFEKPEPIENDLKPILRGLWQGGNVHVIDRFSGKRATDDTPSEAREEIATGGIHSILYWVDKDNPRGPIPSNPDRDPQYRYWEYGVQRWKAGADISEIDPDDLPDDADDVHTDENRPEVRIRNPDSNDRFNPDETVSVRVSIDAEFDIEKVDFFINNKLAGSITDSPYTFSFIPEEIDGISRRNTLRVVAYDEVLNRGEASITFRVDD